MDEVCVGERLNANEASKKITILEEWEIEDWKKKTSSPLCDSSYDRDQREGKGVWIIRLWDNKSSSKRVFFSHKEEEKRK